MRDDMMPTAGQAWLQAVEVELASLGAGDRLEIIDGLRAHILDAVDSGDDVTTVLQRLGTPASVAEQATSEFESAPKEQPAKSRRALPLLAIAFTIVAAILITFLPSYLATSVFDAASDPAPPPMTESTAEDIEVTYDTPSAEQLEAVADNEISEDEYLQGFESYRACLAAEGFEIVVKEPRGDLLDFAIPDAAVQAGADARCYGSDFKQIDILWQQAHAETSDTVALLSDCLRTRGITPSGDVTELENQVRELGLLPSDCN